MSRPRAPARALPLAALLALACGAPEAAPPVPATPVVLVPVEALDVEDQIEATGQLLARSRAEIASEVAGRVTGIHFDEGQQVAAGEAILDVDPERRELELASARARRAEAAAALREQEREAGRVQSLHGRQIASEARLDEARARLELARARAAAAQAELGIAERALRDANVKAPFAGSIARRYVSPGEFVNVGARLVDLVALDPIEVEFHVSERDSARVALAQQVRVRVDPFPDERFDATVTVISPTIDPRTRTLRVLARLANPEGRLRPGLFARAELGVELRRGVLMVPEEAVLQRAAGPIVWRLAAEQRVEQVAVETGLHHAGRVEVRTGLRFGDQVATRGHAGLADGVRISPRQPDGSAVRPELAEAEGAAGATP